MCTCSSHDGNDQRQYNQNGRFYDKNEQRQKSQNEGFYDKNEQKQNKQNERFYDKKQYDEIGRIDKDGKSQNNKIERFYNKSEKASSFGYSEKYENTFQKHQNLSMKQNMEGMYDIIFACESLDKLIEKNNGWKYYYSERYNDLIQSKEKKI